MNQIKSKMSSLLSKMKMNCESSCKTYSESLDREISFGERLRLKIHFFICKACGVYAEQVGFINETTKKHSQATQENLKKTKMNCEAKDRIKQALNSKLKS